MEKKAILSRSGASALARVVTVACLLVANGVAYRSMSHAEFGFWAMLLGVMSLTQNLEFGYRSTMSNRLAALSSRGAASEEERRVTFLSAFYLVMAADVALAGIFLLLCRWVHFEAFFKLGDPILIARAHRLLPPVIVCLLAAMPWSMYFGISNAYDEIELGSFMGGAQAVAMTAAMVLCRATHSSSIMIFSYFATQVATAMGITLFFLARRRWSILPPPWAKIRAVGIDLLPRSMEFFGFGTVTTVQTTVSTLISGYTSGAAAAGDYFVVQRIFSCLTTMNLAILSAVGPLVTRQAYADDWSDVRRRLKMCLLFLWPCLFPLCGGIFFAMHPLLLKVWVGRWITDYWLAGLVLTWACMQGFLDTFSVFLNALGLIRLQAAIAYALVLPCVLLPIWLGRLYGPHGVALAAVICMLPGFIIPFYTRSALRDKRIRV